MTRALARVAGPDDAPALAGVGAALLVLSPGERATSCSCVRAGRPVE